MIHQPVIRGLGNAAEQNGVLVLHKNLEILARDQAHPLPHRIWQNDLAFFGKHGGHSKKILPETFPLPSPVCDVPPWRVAPARLRGTPRADSGMFRRARHRCSSCRPGGVDDSSPILFSRIAQRIYFSLRNASTSSPSSRNADLVSSARSLEMPASGLASKLTLRVRDLSVAYLESTLV